MNIKDHQLQNTEPMQEETYFASAETDNLEKIKKQKELFLSSARASSVLDAVPDILLILNDKRQLVFANSALAEITGKSLEELLGSRPGEILGCVHALNSNLGCGTTKFCRYCGAVNAILNSLAGDKDLQECRILRKKDGSTEALDLRINTTPLAINGSRFSTFHLTDISHQKRREILERVFFHDILNSIGGIYGIMQILAQETDGENKEMSDMALKQCESIIEQIQSQKDLMAAEKNALELHMQTINALETLKDVHNLYSGHLVAENKEIKILPTDPALHLQTDPKILSRILGNMLKNALEASKQGQTVSIGAEKHDKNLVFHVHNNTAMNEKAKSQIFKRSFSTKGSGRGLGTYSIRLFSREYLKGHVWFESSPEQGTTFYLQLGQNLKSA